jgi:hypothetical protein
VGGGWLIFGLPAAETSIHPLDEGKLSSERTEGSKTSIVLPSGGKLSL